MNIIKKVNDFYSESQNYLMKETAKDKEEWKAIPYSWVGRITVNEIHILPK